MTDKAPTSKLAAPSREHLERIRREPSLRPARVSMFLRSTAPLSQAQLGLLEQDGATIRTRAGAIVTLDVDLDAVERVLGHDFIVASEISSPLYPEEGSE